jgi:hypothetical protein
MNFNSFMSLKSMALSDATGFLDRQFGGLEAYLGMGAVAEGLAYRSPAAAKGEGRTACEVVLIPLVIQQDNFAFSGFHAVRPVLAGSNLDGHIAS